MPKTLATSKTDISGKANTNQTMYIGTTAHVLNRASASEDLAGITSLTPGANFTLAQNSVNVLTSESASAVVNTLYLKAGNVGIGTTSPGAKLQLNDGSVTNGTDTSLAIYGGQTGVSNAEYANIFFGQRTDCGAVGAKIGAIKRGSAGNYSSALGFFTSNLSTGSPLERMSISDDGNVGIGTTSPGAKLDVAGNIQIGNPAGAYSVYGDVVYAPGNLHLAAATAVYFNAAAAKPIHMNGNTDVTGTLTTTGNVGIGTTAPGYALQVAGTISASGAGGFNSATYVVGGRNPIWRFGNADGYGISYFQGSAGVGGSDTIGFHFGTATAAASVLQVNPTTVTIQGNVGIGTTAPNYKLEISIDSAGKPGLGGLWTVVSDERIKTDIELADLDRCYEIIKSVPLKRFGWAEGVYTDEQVKDRHGLGWIAQDVQKVFPKAVNTVPFTKKFDTGEVEEYEEPVLDEKGETILVDDKPQVETKTRPVIKEEVIEDCLDLNSGQLIAALYGAVQKLQLEVEKLKG